MFSDKDLPWFSGARCHTGCSILSRIILPDRIYGCKPNGGFHTSIPIFLQCHRHLDLRPEQYACLSSNTSIAAITSQPPSSGSSITTITFPTSYAGIFSFKYSQNLTSATLIPSTSVPHQQCSHSTQFTPSHPHSVVLISAAISSARPPFTRSHR